MVTVNHANWGWEKQWCHHAGKSHRSFVFSDLRQATFCWAATLGAIETLGEEPLPPSTALPPAWGLMGTAKLVGGAGEGLWKRLLARSSRTRSGSGRSTSDSLPLSYSYAHCSWASGKELWDAWLFPKQSEESAVSRQSKMKNNTIDHLETQTPRVRGRQRQKQPRCKTEPITFCSAAFKRETKLKIINGTFKHFTAVCVVPGECAVILRVHGAGPATPVVLVALCPFLPQRSGHVTRRFVLTGQKLVELGAGLGREGDWPPVTEAVLVLSHPEDGVGLGVTATTWSTGEDAGARDKHGEEDRLWLRGREGEGRCLSEVRRCSEEDKRGENRGKSEGSVLCVLAWLWRSNRGVQGGERRPPHLQAGVDDCGMSHCSLFTKGRSDCSRITDENFTLLQGTINLSWNQTGLSVVIHLLLNLGEFSLEIFPVKSAPLEGDMHLFS